MLLKRLDDVGLSDIEMLRENKALESRFIDFKAEAIGGADKDKREFLADVSSFANAAGGDLILGVKTKDGAADEVCGINLADPDKEKQRLINMVRDGLEPRLAVVDIAWLPMSGTTGVMAIRVPRSWSAPHRVTFQKDMHFYVRNSAGKHPMNVDELRRAFGLSASIADRMRAFREERLSAFGSLPFGVRAGPKIAVLIAPVSAFVDPLDLDVRVERRPRDVVRPISNHSSTYQYCLEGVATVTPGSPVEAYSLMFRMGVVECVAPILSNDPTRATVSAYRIEEVVFKAWEGFVAFAKAYGIEPPTSVFATLLEIGNIRISTPSVDEVPSSVCVVPIARLPEVFVGHDDFAKPPEALFKRTLDVAANVFGLPRSPSYDAAGNYAR